jgi:hypothetical protein
MLCGVDLCLSTERDQEQDRFEAKSHINAFWQRSQFLFDLHQYLIAQYHMQRSRHSQLRSPDPEF